MQAYYDRKYSKLHCDYTNSKIYAHTRLGSEPQYEQSASGCPTPRLLLSRAALSVSQSIC